MLVQLMDQFRKTSSEIESAIATNDHSQIGSLDISLIKIWNQLLQFEPTNEHDLQLLTEFLVDQLIGEESISESNQLIKKKILELSLPTQH